MSLEKVLDDKISDLLVKIDKQKVPKHVAIIMDGNGRWATRKLQKDLTDVFVLLFQKKQVRYH